MSFGYRLIWNFEEKLVTCDLERLEWFNDISAHMIIRIQPNEYLEISMVDP